MSRQMTKNRVFGTKLISHFLLEHIKLCRPLEQTLTPFKYVRVSRRDLVGQAISAMLAFHTGTYHIRDEAEHQRYRERLANFQISPADLRRVEDLRQSFAVQRRQMDDFLQRHSITPLEVVFEDLIAEPVRSVNAVLSFLSVPTTVENVSVTVRKTQDEITESVRAMYLEGSYSS
jgi:LPS sulfotransferase NodH